MLNGCDADLVLVGHTHWPLDRQVGGVRVVNPGTTTYPWAPDLRASYALIEADESQHSVSLHRVAFDVESVIQSIRESAYYPNPEWLVERYTNRRRPPWDQEAEA